MSPIQEKVEQSGRPSFWTWKKTAVAVGVVAGIVLTMWGANYYLTAQSSAHDYKLLGNMALDQAEPGSFARERMCFPVKAGLDQAYIREWQFKQMSAPQSPNLCAYVDYQIENRYFNGLDPDSLQALMPGKHSTSELETRELYDRNVGETIPCVVSSLKGRVSECYDVCIAASVVRNNFKVDMRDRSKHVPGVVYETRNAIKYADSIDDPAYMVGKYLLDTKEKSCAAYLAATMRTNKSLDAISSFLRSIWGWKSA